MSDYDPDFEQMRLTMLARQYPDIVAHKVRVIFFAEDNEDRISWSRWFLEDEKVGARCSETGFKIELMNLLDIFIQYRGQCNQLPKNAGVVEFTGDVVTIEWHTKISADTMLAAD
tara:strand:- start:77302 stop:77646 length:345 start_codon:yes stop_codon:yes gene_type:complete